MRTGLAVAAACFALTSTPVQAGDVAGLGWLAGCWRMQDGVRLTEETWLAPAGGVAVGVGRTLRDGTLRQYEYMRIEAVDGVPTFYATQFNREATIAFPAITQTADEIVFENKAHDFPQQIVYRRTDTGLHAHISGPVNGETRTINFDYQRCQP